MLIKFFSTGRGDGRGPTDYCCNMQVPTIISEPDPHTGRLKGRVLRDEKGKPVLKTRQPPPEILTGDPERTRELIDSLDFRWRYSSGVIAFAPTDQPTEDQQKRLMADFEALAFAGLERERYDILWVRHIHEGSAELHFVIPRVELLTGKSYNPAPPGWEPIFAPLRDAWNIECGWARPDDPARARPKQLGHTHLQLAENLRAGLTEIDEPKGLITDYLMACIDAGLIDDRAGIVTTLEALGMTINREGQDYLSVRPRPDAKPIRLKGQIYGQDFSRAAFESRAPAEIPGESPAEPTTNTERAASARAQLAEAIAKRATYNTQRYAVRAPAGSAAEMSLEITAAHPVSSPLRAEGNPDEAEADMVPDLRQYLREQLRTDAIPAGPSYPRVKAETKAQSRPALPRQAAAEPNADFEQTFRQMIFSIGEIARNYYERARETIIASTRAAFAAIRRGHEQARSAEQAARQASERLGESGRMLEQLHSQVVGLISEPDQDQFLK